jgi:integrase
VAKDVHLFPDLKPDQLSKRAGNWSKWWGRYVRAMGITDPRKVFHSFRHGFKAACRAAEIEEEVHDGITGHAGGGEGRRYGKGKIPMKVLNKAMERVSFDVDLTHLLVPADIGAAD